VTVYFGNVGLNDTTNLQCNASNKHVEEAAFALDAN
jgi:hypothetical protein